MHKLICGLAPLLIATASLARAGADVPPAAFADPQRRATLLQAVPRIDALMEAALREPGLPALSWALVIDGEVVHARAFGLRDVAAGAPAEVQTEFRIASMTKSFTALAVLKLRDEGKLKLDDPVATYVPELRRWQQPTGDAGPVTLRQLLAHTGGLPEDNPQGDRQLALTPAQFSAWLQSAPPLASVPGSAFEYSNLGYMILGRVVTRVSGRPYQVYIRDDILRPLGMLETHWGPAQVAPERLALGYRRAGDGWQAEPMLEDGEGGAMGGLISSARDVGRWVAYMLSAWPPRDGAEAGPVARRTLREMQSGLGHPELWMVRRQPGGPVTGLAHSYGFGLGAAHNCAWGREVSHSGGLPGFSSQMRWLPDHGVGVVVLGSRTYRGTGQPAQLALEALKDTGALKPRQAQPAAALRRAAGEVAALVDQWSDERAGALAADNLFLDEPLAARREAIAKVRQDLGTCTPGALVAENALRGVQALACERGRLDITLTLAPTQPPRVQHLSVRKVPEPPPVPPVDTCVR
jgi:CubicO group peptidase (beta-lactamase class C family)